MITSTSERKDNFEQQNEKICLCFRHKIFQCVSKPEMRSHIKTVTILVLLVLTIVFMTLYLNCKQNEDLTVDLDKSDIKSGFTQNEDLIVYLNKSGLNVERMLSLKDKTRKTKNMQNEKNEEIVYVFTFWDKGMSDFKKNKFNSLCLKTIEQSVLYANQEMQKMIKNNSKIINNNNNKTIKFEFLMLDSTNIFEWLLPHELPNTLFHDKLDIIPCHVADLVRFAFLAKYGGIYLDATMLFLDYYFLFEKYMECAYKFNVNTSIYDLSQKELCSVIGSLTMRQSNRKIEYGIWLLISPISMISPFLIEITHIHKQIMHNRFEWNDNSPYYKSEPEHYLLLGDRTIYNLLHKLQHTITNNYAYVTLWDYNDKQAITNVNANSNLLFWKYLGHWYDNDNDSLHWFNNTNQRIPEIVHHLIARNDISDTNQPQIFWGNNHQKPSYLKFCGAGKSIDPNKIHSLKQIFIYPHSPFPTNF